MLKLCRMELCINFVNDREDDLTSEYGNGDDAIDFTRNAFGILILDENCDITYFAY